MTAPSGVVGICSGHGNASGSESAGTSAGSLDQPSNESAFSGTPEPKQGSTGSRSEIHYPCIHDQNKMYESKHNRKLIRFVTVIAYMFAVSLAAIVLSLYYFFLWDPYMQNNSFSDPPNSIGGMGHNAAFLPQGMDGGFRGGRKRASLHTVNVQPRLMSLGTPSRGPPQSAAHPHSAENDHSPSPYQVLTTQYLVPSNLDVPSNVSPPVETSSEPIDSQLGAQPRPMPVALMLLAKVQTALGEVNPAMHISQVREDGKSLSASEIRKEEEVNEVEANSLAARQTTASLSITASTERNSHLDDHLVAFDAAST